MFHPTSRIPVLALALVLTGCASAEKRMEQGQELETAGRFEAAMVRYVEALEKDPELVEARERLQVVGDSAVAQRLDGARGLRMRGDYVNAAAQYRGVDGIVARARSVGVRLTLPAEYGSQRRETFQRAFDGLMDHGWNEVERGRWESGVDAFRTARRSFEPTAEQRDASLLAESEALLAWSRQDLEAGRLRAAFHRAANVQHMEWVPPENMTEADRIMGEALDAGEVELLVLPVVAGGRSRAVDPTLLILEAQVNDHLDRGPWASPPPFLRLTDPIRVRDLVRRAGVLGGLRAPAMGLLLELVEADYGVWLEILDTEALEFDVKQRTRTARTRAGENTTFVVEEGQRRIRARARVVVMDRVGNEVSHMEVLGTGVGPFERGIYQGDPRELNLSRRQVHWFDRMAQEAQEDAIRQALAADLSNQLATAVFDPVLARIP